MIAVHGLVEHSQDNECTNSAINYFRIISSVLYLSAYFRNSQMLVMSSNPCCRTHHQADLYPTRFHNHFTHATWLDYSWGCSSENIKGFYEIIGTPGRIRTCGLRIRSPALYPAELRALMTRVIRVICEICGLKKVNPI